MYSIDIVFFSLHKHAGFRAGLLNRMVKYCFSYTIDYIIIGRFLMNLYFFYNFSNIFYDSFTPAGDQRATAKTGRARLENVTALFFNIWRRSMLSRASDESKTQQKKKKRAGKIRTLVSMPERDSLIQSSRRSSSEERSFTIAFRAIYKQLIKACPELV